jgi:hypothetical protein
MERISVLIQSMKIYIEKKEIVDFNNFNFENNEFLNKKHIRENQSLLY